MNRRAFLGLAVAGVLVPVEEPKYTSLFYPGEYGKLRETVMYQGHPHVVKTIWRKPDGTISMTVLRPVNAGPLRDELYGEYTESV